VNKRENGELGSLYTYIIPDQNTFMNKLLLAYLYHL